MNDLWELQEETVVDTETVDAIILGAGVSGLVAASVLVKQNTARIMVIDSYDRVGGNHIDWSRDGFTFDVGSLIFQDDSPLVKHFPQLLDHYVHIHPSWGRLNPQRKVTTYPISVKDDILAAGPVVIGRILFSVLFARLRGKTMRNAKDFAAYWIGEYLLRRSGLENYMARFYGVAPDYIDLELAQKRMLWIKENSSLTNLLRKLLPKKPSVDHVPNKQLARPKAGYATLYEPVTQALGQNGVSFKLGMDITKLEKIDDDRFVVTSSCGKTVTAPRMISTIPINKLCDLCGLKQKRPLQTITLISLYFSFAGKRGFEQSILYNFSYEAAWKRLTVYSDFYGPTDGREYFAVEVVANDTITSIALAEAEFRQHVAKNGIFDGDLRLEGGHVLDNAYPIYVHGAAADARQQIERLKQYGIESFGRHGAFNYQPTARVSTLEVEEALDYRHPEPQPA